MTHEPVALPSTRARGTAKAKRSRWRRLAWISPLLLLPPLAWLTRAHTVHPLLIRAAERYGPRYGWKVRIAGLEGDWWHGLEALGVELEPVEAQPGLRRLALERVALGYDLSFLWSGDLERLRELHAKGLDLELALGAEESTEASATSEPPRLPARLPRISLEDARVRIALGDGQDCLLTGIQISSSPKPGQESQELSLSVAEARLPLAWRLPPLDLELRAALERSGLVIEETRIHGEGLRLHGQEIALPSTWKDAGALLGAIEGELDLELDPALALVLPPTDGRAREGELDLALRAARGVLELERGRLRVSDALDLDWQGRVDLLGDGGYDLTATIERGDLRNLTSFLAGPDASGSLSGGFRLLGALDRPRLELTLTGEECVLAEQVLGRLELALTADDQRIELTGLRLRGPSATADVQASLPVALLTGAAVDEQELSLLARASSGALSELPLGTSALELALERPASLELELQGAASAPRGRLTLALPALRLEAPGLADNPSWKAATDLVLTLDQRLRLERCTLESEHGLHAEARGELDWQLDWAELLQGRYEDPLDRPLRLDLTAELEDLSWLAALVPSIRRSAGGLSAEVALRGTARAPELEGKLAIRDGALRLASDFPPLTGIRGELELHPGEILVHELATELGAAPAVLDGRIALAGDAPALELRLSGQNLLLARSPSLRLRADLDLAVGGTLTSPALTGKVGLRNTRLRQDVDFLSLLQPGGAASPKTSGLTLFSFSDPPLSTLRFDVLIDAAEPIVLEGNVAGATIRPALKLSGTGAIPTPEGRVFLDDLELSLPGGRFRFPRGTVEFERSNPFEPRLDLMGEARLSGHDVTMHVTGSLSEPQVELSSSPPLGRERLLLLVLSGTLPPEEQLGESGRAATRSITLYVAKDLLSRWLSGSSEGGEDSLMSRLEIVTGSEVSKAGVLSTEASLRLREGVLRDNDTLYLVAERDVYEDYNMGLRIVFRFP